jgi:hypothetical protein
MNMPGFNAKASLYATSRHYGYAGVSAVGILDSVLAQSLFCAKLGEECGGIDLFCCPGLRCTGGRGGLGICVPGHRPCCQPPGCQICPWPL